MNEESRFLAMMSGKDKCLNAKRFFFSKREDKLGMLKITQTGCNKHVKVHHLNKPNDEN